MHERDATTNPESEPLVHDPLTDGDGAIGYSYGLLDADPGTWEPETILGDYRWIGRLIFG